MPKGYKCDMCDEFDRHTHNMTTVDMGAAATEDARRIEPTYVLCPDCATDLREIIQDVDIPEEIREEAL